LIYLDGPGYVSRAGVWGIFIPRSVRRYAKASWGRMSRERPSGIHIPDDQVAESPADLLTANLHNRLDHLLNGHIVSIDQG